MIKAISRCIAATAVSLLSAYLSAPAQAVTFNFSYLDDTNGDLLSGVLDGDIQDDGDIVQVSTVGMTTLNGSTPPPITFIDSISDYVGQTDNTPPVVSFSGQTMNLVACFSFEDNPCFEGFVFDSEGRLSLNEPTYARSPSFSTGIIGPVPFDAANWSLVAQSLSPQSVPEPSVVTGIFGSLVLLTTLKRSAKRA